MWLRSSARALLVAAVTALALMLSGCPGGGSGSSGSGGGYHLHA